MGARRGIAIATALVAQVTRVGPVFADDAALRSAVEADWAAQERRLGRSDHDPQAVRDALDRLEKLLRRRPGAAGRHGRSLRRLRRAGSRVDLLAPAERIALYRRIRWIGRELALGQPPLAGRPVVFLKRRRFICQMLHEYVGYFCDYGDVAGGGVFVLPRPERSLKVRDLVRGRLPRGNYTTLALSYDAKTIYFAFAERAATKPDYYSPQRRCFHLYAIRPDGGDLRQLTHGPHDDFDPRPLPDGGVAFMSTRRGGFTRCNNPWEPIPVYTLHRLDFRPDGPPAIRTLSFHETNEWHPWVLNDGRIVYSRWDYVDRSAANFHGLWVSAPDGTNPTVLFGSYTRRINACFQPRALPGCDRILFLAGAHHADVGGSIVRVDPSRASLDPRTGHDRLDAVELLTPEVCFPEAPGWPKSYFHSPWPISPDAMLVSFSFDPLPGMGPRERRDTETGLYYFDRFGNLELLYRQRGISCMYPVPLSPRPRPPVMGSTLDPALGDEGELVLTDVTRSLMPMPGTTQRSNDQRVRAKRSEAARRIVRLRIFQVLPKTRTHTVNRPRIGHANAESARMLLGTVPVESDGSAYFRLPARRPVYFQAVDQHGRAVQSMRSVTYLQPGERRGCVGCHEPRRAAPASRRLLATRRAPSPIAPGPDGTRPFCYARLIQPILDRRCVRCHDGTKGEGKGPLDLTGRPDGHFTRSYNALRPYVRWYEWGGASIRQTVTRPGEIGADASRLPKLLAARPHVDRVQLTPAERRCLLVWLDANVPFYGTYDEAHQRAQQAGKAIPPPAAQ